MSRKHQFHPYIDECEEHTCLSCDHHRTSIDDIPCAICNTEILANNKHVCICCWTEEQKTRRFEE